MRSFSAHAPRHAAFHRGGMWVARLNTTSWPAAASFTASGSKRSPSTGVAPSERSSSALSGPRATAVTLWPAPISRRTARLPSTPVAPATNAFTLLPPGTRQPPWWPAPVHPCVCAIGGAISRRSRKRSAASAPRQQEAAAQRTPAGPGHRHLGRARDLALPRLAPQLEAGLMQEAVAVQAAGRAPAAGGVEGDLAVTGNARPALDERPPLPLAAEAEGLEPGHG